MTESPNTLSFLHHGREHTLFVTKATRVRAGLEPKRRLQAQFHSSDDSMKISLVEKRSDRLSPGQYLRRWHALKDAGIPVVPSIRETTNKRVVMTDLAADGSQLYGKSVYLKLIGSQDDPGKYKPHPVDGIFKNIITDSIDTIRSEARRYAELATQHGINLPRDGDPFELVVHPDGTYQILVLDLSRVTFPRIPAGNNIVANDFIQDLLDIQILL